MPALLLLIGKLKKAMQAWKERARQLKKEIYALYFAYKDPRVPIYAKVLAALIVGYALSPIDLIPDFIPILGYLDDLILVPLGIMFVLRMIPQNVMAECREKAETAIAQGQSKPTNWVAASLIVCTWIVFGLAIAFFIRELIQG